jgi:hypothetical protein
MGAARAVFATRERHRVQVFANSSTGEPIVQTAGGKART